MTVAGNPRANCIATQFVASGLPDENAAGDGDASSGGAHAAEDPVALVRGKGSVLMPPTGDG
jgi:hypothetical protein